MMRLRSLAGDAQKVIRTVDPITSTIKPNRHRDATVSFKNLVSVSPFEARLELHRALSCTDITLIYSLLALKPSLAARFHKAFPHISQATASQAALVRHITRSDKHILLRDLTGAGKSLALLLALLSFSTQRRSPHGSRPRSVLLVPHNALAIQIESWLRLLFSSNTSDARQLDSIAHVYYRGANARSFSLNNPPQLVIATATRAADIVAECTKSDQSLQSIFGDIGVVALDEADALVDLPG